MKNIEIYGVTELNKTECQLVNGGGWLSWGAGAVLGFIYERAIMRMERVQVKLDSGWESGAIR